MPTYSYRCTDCGEAFDIQQAFTDDSLTVCPNCGGALRKLFTSVGVTFNGSGFYRNDSRAPAASEGRSSSASSESGSSTSESSGAGSSGAGSSGAGSSGAAAAKSESSSGSGTSTTTASPATKEE